jgi:uncharacterized membrane protein YkoI
MKRRFTIVIAGLVGAGALVFGGTFAFGDGGAGIWDDGHFVTPGSLDDGTDLLPETKITLAEAHAAAQKAADGGLGQVDLERYEGRVVYMVDVGDQEVRVDATDGSIVAIDPRD